MPGGEMGDATPEERPRVLNRAGRERALIDAAAKLFAVQGYESTTTRQIAARAGCAEGLISRYFKGKAGLLRALIQQHFDEEVEEFRDDSPAAASLGEEIIRRVEWDFDHLLADFDFLRVILPRVILDPHLAKEVESVGPGRHEKLIRERLAVHERFCALPQEEREALVQMITGVGMEFGFFGPVMGEPPDKAKSKAMAIARILARAF
jgi:AcrR family transcriptional regulator